MKADKESPALQNGINNSKPEIVHQLLLETSVILLVLAQANKYMGMKLLVKTGKTVKTKSLND